MKIIEPAKTRYPESIRLQEIYTMLLSGQGGFLETADYLELHAYHEKYKRIFDDAMDSADTKAAADAMSKFKLFCVAMLDDHYQKHFKPKALPTV